MLPGVFFSELILIGSGSLCPYVKVYEIIPISRLHMVP